MDVGVGQETGLPPGIVNSQDPRDIPDAPQKSEAAMEVPEGFHVTLVAAEPQIHQPIAFDFDDRGRLWVVECFSHPEWKAVGQDRVVILEDSDGDGRADRRQVFWNQGRYLTGIAYGYGGVFLCNTPDLIFVPDSDDDGRPDGPPEVLLEGWSHRNRNNVFNNLCFGPDGWLYGAVGQDQPFRVGPPGTPEEDRAVLSRGIWRYHPRDRQFEVVALGAVNPWGLDFNEVGDGFFTNCVLPHLWHLIRGAYYERRPGERDHALAYERIGPICDHRHWGEGPWTSSRGGRGSHHQAGGGHAHTGAAIYLADQWPAPFRGLFYTGNLHGNRINRDTLERRGSSYVARHRPDFLMAHSPWFRCLSQKVGPDGSMYITDWHDVGECHDNDGSHRSSGRLYRVSFGQPPTVQVALATASDEELGELLEHANAWYRRRARRLLQERSERTPAPRLKAALHQRFRQADDVVSRLEILWALYGMEQAEDAWLQTLLGDADPYIRSWAVRLLVDRGAPSSEAQQALVRLGRTDASAYVRLSLASALPHLSKTQRWQLAGHLAGHAEDADDAAIPPMIWYGVADDVVAQPEQAIGLLRVSAMPRLTRWIARCLTEAVPSAPDRRAVSEQTAP